jgi:4-hydroxy-3-polyprenylbenzoate decarboxylase
VKICVAITGASGVILGQRVLENLSGHETHLIVSESAWRVIGLELGRHAQLNATYQYENTDIAAPLSSSSFLLDAMVVVPCSLKTLAGIAHGYADNLILRAAENAIRLNRRLVVVPRETPLSLSAIENMRQVRLAGAIVLPPVMAYYYAPQSVDDVTNFLVGKILDALGVEHQLFRRWAGAPQEEERVHPKF